MNENLVYHYRSPWQIYAMNFCTNPARSFTLALGSFVGTQYNYIQLISLNEEIEAFEPISEVEQIYPTTKLMWCPDPSMNILASTGDSLKLWNCDSDMILKSNLLTESKKEFPPPLTSFDWNTVNNNIIGTSSINTTCTIWDIEKETVSAHMIAHDQPAYDIAFSQGVSIFATAGGDGSVRQFDLRNLENSTVLYEKQDISACLRLAWNKLEPYYLATIMLDSNSIVVLDIRHPSIPVYQLNGHINCVNTLAWSPVSSSHLITGADDHQALIWEINHASPTIDPALVYTSDSEINNLVWSNVNPDWIAFSKNKEISILRI
jgi:DDB1- and CUL4-associated factor 7